MRMIYKSGKSMVLLFLCFVILVSMAAPAFADDAAEEQSIINEKELTGKVETFLSDHNINKSNFSIGFYYSGTGDTWYYNGDKWFYPASMYKVPLIMLLAEKVKAGEITQDQKIVPPSDLDVSTIEEYILTYSNNDYAHMIRKYLGGDAVWREDAKRYASLTDEEYPEDYIDYCYFSNRYMTEVMITLFNESERFPHVIDCLLEGEPTHYFRLAMEGKYDIAQKYGAYEEMQGHNFNHATGIVYTEHPCIITVMTDNVTGYEKVISDAAVMMTEYAESLDKKLAAYEAQLAAAEEEAKREEEQKAAEEEQQRAIEEKNRQEAEHAQMVIESQAQLQTARKVLWIRLAVLFGGLAVLAVVITTAVNASKRRKRRKRYEAYRKTYEAEQRAKHSSRNGGYKPKH